MTETASPFLLRVPKSALLASILIHLGVLFLLGLFSSEAVSNWIRQMVGLEPKAMEAQSFVQVDVVGLPDHTLRDKINPLLPEVAKPEATTAKINPETRPVEPDIMSDKAQNQKKAETEKAKEKAERKKQQERALREALEETKRQQALKGLQNESGARGRGKLKGNRLSEGTSSTGMVGTAKDKYIGILTESIKQQFNVFSWQQKKGLVAEVQLLLLPNGRVKWRKIIKPSRDVLYDSAVLQAIDDAQPFPIPEDRSLIRDEITINFKP